MASDLEKAREAAEKFAEQAQDIADEAQNSANWVKGAVELFNQATVDVEALADAAAAAGHGISGGVIDPFVFRLAIFVLAIFVGYYVVWSVTPALHTPLMSVTNAISSVIVVGALLAVGIQAAGFMSGFFGFIALVLASVNIFGGFLVTHRMLAMYKKKER
jgi:NAD(P) transhydrogenase subunit alpha